MKVDRPRLKIAYIVHSLNLGGAERLAADMAIRLSDQFAISVVCLDEPGLWASDLRKRGIPVHCIRRQPGLDLRVPWRLARFARHHRIELFHAHQTTPWFYAALARLFAPGVKLLFEEHGRHYPEVEKAGRIGVNRRIIQPLTHKIVAVSDDVRQRLVRYEGLDPRRIQVIYNGTEVPDLPVKMERAKLRGSLGFSEADFVISTVGRFDPIKNFPLLVEALRLASPREPRLGAAFVGNGAELARVRNLAAAAGLSERICFPGYRSDAARISSSSDLFVLPSLSEGTSVALLEAMAAGVPAVVTDVGGNPEVVIDGETGWVVPSGDSEALCDAILRAVRDPAERQSRGAAAKVRFEKRFTFQRMLERYVRVYWEMS